MPPTGGLAPPLTTKPRSAFVRLRAVTPPPHAPPASAADWTALLAAALPAAFGDADGARLAYRILSTAAGERPGEAVAIVQVRAGEERRVWAALTLATAYAGRPVRVDVAGGAGERGSALGVRAARLWAAWRCGVGPSRRRWVGCRWGPAPASRRALVGAPHSSHRAGSGGAPGAAGRCIGHRPLEVGPCVRGGQPRAAIDVRKTQVADVCRPWSTITDPPVAGTSVACGVAWRKELSLITTKGQGQERTHHHHTRTTRAPTDPGCGHLRASTTPHQL